jgi:probable rRNA maturation factor
LGWAEAELSLTLLSDRAMARLNRETFGRRGPTNVIAFPVDAPAGGQAAAAAGQGPPPVLGEVVISLETTRRQAQENDWDWQELFDFFLIHGILHLIGYDHEDLRAEAAGGGPGEHSSPALPPHPPPQPPSGFLGVALPQEAFGLLGATAISNPLRGWGRGCGGGGRGL